MLISKEQFSHVPERGSQNHERFETKANGKGEHKKRISLCSFTKKKNVCFVNVLSLFIIKYLTNVIDVYLSSS